jgi:uncharacterized protein YbaR (Trm112 family)
MRGALACPHCEHEFAVDGVCETGVLYCPKCGGEVRL